MFPLGVGPTRRRNSASQHATFTKEREREREREKIITVVGFEPAIPTSERTQFLTYDPVATETGLSHSHDIKKNNIQRLKTASPAH
jgi:hypothetical protein